MRDVRHRVREEETMHRLEQGLSKNLCVEWWDPCPQEVSNLIYSPQARD